MKLLLFLCMITVSTVVIGLSMTIDRTILSSMQGTRKTTAWWQPNTTSTTRSPSPWVPLVFRPTEHLNSSETVSLDPFLSYAADESVTERLTDRSDLGVLARSPLPSRPRRGGPYRRRYRRAMRSLYPRTPWCAAPSPRSA